MVEVTVSLIDQTPDPMGPESKPEELGSIIGGALKRLRTKRALSLEALARLAGVSRAMIGQIEGGRSMPTIGLLWKIARALEVPFSALIGSGNGGGIAVMRADRSKVLTSKDGSFTSRALFPYDSERRVEFYELTMAPGALELAEPHAPGTTENLTVAQGQVEIAAGGETSLLACGDSVYFQADVPHSYRNVGPDKAIMFLVMTYTTTIG
jgi:transcriptional regulator with XRE-family HTH domain